MYKSETVYKNRYGDDYFFHEHDEDVYTFNMTGNSMDYCRFGGREGQEQVTMDDLGMFDPSGGPYISIGTEIDKKPVTKIYNRDSVFYIETKRKQNADT